MSNMIRSTSLTVILAVTPLFTSIPTYAFDSVPLHTIYSQKYNLTISGKVHSLKRVDGGVEVRMEATPVEGKPVEARTQVGPDGSFMLTVSFEGYPNQQVDWKLTAQAGYVTSSYINTLSQEGRHILSDNTSIIVNQSIDMAASPLVVALYY